MGPLGWIWAFAWHLVTRGLISMALSLAIALPSLLAVGGGGGGALGEGAGRDSPEGGRRPHNRDAGRSLGAANGLFQRRPSSAPAAVGEEEEGGGVEPSQFEFTRQGSGTGQDASAEKAGGPYVGVFLPYESTAVGRFIFDTLGVRSAVLQAVRLIAGLPLPSHSDLLMLAALAPITLYYGTAASIARMTGAPFLLGAEETVLLILASVAVGR